MVETLQDYIKNWLSAKKHRSLKQLAEECGLNYGTVRNMADGKAVPNGETILRVLLATTTIENMHAFVQEHLPHLSPYSKALTKLDMHFAKPFSFLRKHCEVLMEISFGPISHSRLSQRFGPSLPSVLEDLLRLEMILLKDDVYAIADDHIFVPYQALATENSRLIIDRVDLNLRGNTILAYSGGLTIEAAREVFRIIEQAQAEILSVFKNPDNTGDTRVAVTLAMTLC